MSPKKPPPSPPVSEKRKRLIKPRIASSASRTPREQRYVDRMITRVMARRQQITEQMNIGVEQAAKLTHSNHPEDMQLRARLMLRLRALMRLRKKLDDDYTHWDDINDLGYDKDDPDDYNYPPPPPPPPPPPALFA